jgi:ComF family protein
MSGTAESLFASLFPADCRLCGTPLIKISRLPVCEDCLLAMRPFAGGVCFTCGERLVSPYAFSAEGGEPACGLCRRLAPPFSQAVAYGSYDGGLRELIHLLKYQQVRPAAAVLGRMLDEAIRGLPVLPGTVVVPVPLDGNKLRQRGFHAAELIAQAALKLDSRAMLLRPHAMERRPETQSQAGLTSHQRRENMRGAFVVTRPQDISECEVLLVDDVFTTGATVSECARVLRLSGASNVLVATVARTLKVNAAFREPERTENLLAMAAAG